MERFKVLFIAFVAIFFLGKASAQQYTPMTAAGYQMKRIKADSTLHIPSFCGVPTLRNSTAKDGALAMDTCNNKLYKWTNQAGWSEITGGGGGGGTVTSVATGYGLTGGPITGAGTLLVDSATLSNKYLRIVDTANKWVSSVTKVNDSTIRVVKDGTTSDLLIRGNATGTTSISDTAKVVIAKVHNAEATTLTRGTVVYLYGANGDVASVKRANNKLDATSSKTFGMVRRDIAAGDTGYITTQGQIEKLNLGSYTEGDVLWLDSLDGQFTKVKPVAPYHGVFVGIVERANAGNGLAYIKPQNGYEISEIHDVLISGVVNNNILVYSDTQSLWKNRNIYTIVDTTNIIATKSNVNTKANLSQGAYSMLTNNTNATANMASTPFRDAGSQTYSGTITWNQTSPPSGTTNHSYRWTQVGKMVTLHISLVYGTASGVNQTTVQMSLPTDCPTPITPSGMTATNLDILYYGNGNIYTINNTIPTIAGFVVLRGTAAGGYEVVCTRAASAASARYVNVTIQYFTNTTY